MDWETRFKNLITALATDYKAIRTFITGTSGGALGGLNTTSQHIVGAINELEAAGGAEVDPATETQAGIVELATDVEALAFTTDGAVLTPGNLGAVLNVNNGIPKLDAAGKVASAQLPSFVDDVIEVANFAALPGTGEAGKIWVTLDTNNQYRWSGSAWQEIVASPGSTDEVSEGSVNLYFTNARADTRADLRIAAVMGDDFDMVAYYEAAKA